MKDLLQENEVSQEVEEIWKGQYLHIRSVEKAAYLGRGGAAGLGGGQGYRGVE